MTLRERLVRQWPMAARDLAGVTGGGLIAYGVGQIYSPAGWIALGLMLVGGAFLSAKASA